MTDLEPIAADEALALYTQDILADRAEWTEYSHDSRLGHFVRWCTEEEDLNNLNRLTGRDLHRYRLWRRDDGDLSKVTVKTQMDTLRVFIRWLESIDGVEPDLSTKVQSPDIDRKNSRDEMVESDRAQAILKHLQKYQYATIEHIVILLAWHVRARIGCLHALDLDDYDSANEYIEIEHRPEAETQSRSRGSTLLASATASTMVLESELLSARRVVMRSCDAILVTRHAHRL